MNQHPDADAGIRIDLPGSGGEHRIHCLGVEILVSGLRTADMAEKAILQHLPAFSGRIIIPLSKRSPLMPALCSAVCPDSRITVFELDCHDARLVREKLAALPGIEVMVAEDLPSSEDRPQLALYNVGEQEDRLLVLETVERLASVMPQGSRILTALPSRRRDLEAKFRKTLERISILEDHREFRLLQGFTPARREDWNPRQCAFTATTREAAVELVSRPGVFAHGRPDAGAIALAESAAIEPGQSLLELGCGCGTVSMLLAAALKKRSGAFPKRLVMVDSNARAVECAKIAATKLGLAEAEFVLSDLYEPWPGAFDVVLANPPYFADLRVCRFFIETAASALHEGGRLYLVTKKGREVLKMAEESGFEVESSQRRGYDIIEGTARKGAEGKPLFRQAPERPKPDSHRSANKKVRKSLKT